MAKIIFLKEEIYFNEKIEVKGEIYEKASIFVKRKSWYNEYWLIDWLFWSIGLDLGTDAMFYMDKEVFEGLKSDLKKDIASLEKDINVEKFNLQDHLDEMSRDEFLKRIKEFHKEVEDFHPKGDLWIHVV